LVLNVNDFFIVEYDSAVIARFFACDDFTNNPGRLMIQFFEFTTKCLRIGTR